MEAFGLFVVSERLKVGKNICNKQTVLCHVNRVVKSSVLHVHRMLAT